MLKKIELENYRCFEKSTLSFKQLTVIVGNNNAGKSTIIEALRLISSVVRKFKVTNYSTPPSGLGLHRAILGFKINPDQFNIDLRTIVFDLKKDVNAIITAYFENKSRIVITANQDEAFANIYDPDGMIIRTKSQAQKLNLCEICIMPQLGLIREDEKLLATETIKKNLDTRLSSRHFRNELWLFGEDYYKSFKELAESTWSGLRVQSLEYNPIDSEFISLYLYDGGYSAEIGNMGSGLQMWLQIIWFISRCPETCTIILDEPDVYMHPDMQSEILNIIRSKFKQKIIATHSAEIITRVKPENIVKIDKSSRRMLYANNSRAVQKIIELIGSTQNMSLIRFGTVTKCIFVEGKDIALIEQFQNICCPYSDFVISDFPTVSLGGWSRFDEALGAARLFYEYTDGLFQTICILDRDYHLENEISELYKKAEENHLHLIVWDKKELENYLVIPKAIFRITQLGEEKYNDFLIELEKGINTLKEGTIYSFTDQFFSLTRNEGAGNANRKATKYVEEKWLDLNSKLALVNGKDAINIVNNLLQQTYQRHCSKQEIFKNIKVDDLDPQIIDTIDYILNR